MSKIRTKKTAAPESKYLAEISIAEKEQEKYIKKADKIVKRYRDEDRDDRKTTDDDVPARSNMLWSMVETAAPMLYGRKPMVEADRRYKDADPIGRTACQIWERSTQYCIDNYDFNGVMQAVVKDFQLAGRGTAWLRYEPAVYDDQIAYQEVLADHVEYKDFLHAPAKQWRAVRWVARRIYLTKKQLKARFPDDYKNIGLDYSLTGKEDRDDRVTDDPAEYKQAKIYELWDSDTMKVSWVSKAFPGGLIETIDDPLGLHDFYPTPKPLFATTTTGTLIPIPDYCEYQDQARELDVITMKIALLEDALRMVGFYDASYANDMSSLYGGTRQNEMIPIANWQKLQAAGGIKGIAEWMPLDQIVQAMQGLYSHREQVKQDLYEITGFADIIRGASSQVQTTAREQRIKSSFVSKRLQARQDEVVRYASDLIALHGEIVAEHFEPETLAAMAGFETSQPEVQQTFMQALELLKNDPMRCFRLSIASDSMKAVDDELNKEQTKEFVEAFSTLIDKSMQVMQMAPILAPLMGEAMMHTIRRFNAGRTLEASIEQGMAGLAQMAQAAMSQPPTADPETMKVQAKLQLEQQLAQTKLQLENQQSQNDFQLKQAEFQQKAQMNQAEIQGRMALERERGQQQMALDQQRMQQELVLNQQKAQAEMQLAIEKAQLEMNLKAAALKQRGEVDIKKAALGSGIKDLHIGKEGEITSRPVVRKRGTIKTDPLTGERVIDIVEVPMAVEEPAEESILGSGIKDLHIGKEGEITSRPVVRKRGTIKTDPLTGERVIDMVEVPMAVEEPAEESIG